MHSFPLYFIFSTLSPRFDFIFFPQRILQISCFCFPKYRNALLSTVCSIFLAAHKTVFVMYLVCLPFKFVQFGVCRPLVVFPWIHCPPTNHSYPSPSLHLTPILTKNKYFSTPSTHLFKILVIVSYLISYPVSGPSSPRPVKKARIGTYKVVV